jgi:hypothetical protein
LWRSDWSWSYEISVEVFLAEFLRKMSRVILPLAFLPEINPNKA